MAAPQWTGGKCKSVQQAKAFLRHNAMDRRMEENHKNHHIDKALTKYNFSYRGLDYEQVCEAFDRRLSELDMGRQSSGKNARVVMQSVIIYPPKGITDRATLAAWFRDAGAVLEDMYGENLIDMQVDFDELHQYLDKDSGELVWSREHGHARIVPEVDGKLNGKKFATRAAINSLNAALDEMSLRQYGVPMMDGSKKKGGRTVEELKAASEQAEVVKQAQEAAEAIRKAAEAEAAQVRRDAQTALRGALRAEERAKDKEADLERERKKVLDALGDARDALEVIQGMEAELKAQRAAEGPLRAFVAARKGGPGVLAKYDQEQAKQDKQRAASKGGAVSRVQRAARLVGQPGGPDWQFGD